MFNSNNEANDDDDFFVPTASSSSNLAHLFGASNAAARQDLKNSLSYTPPKQPKPIDIQQAQNLAPTQQQKKLVCAKTISLSKLVDSTFSAIGKFGIAIIADSISADLILYKTKQAILSTSKLSLNFCYKVNDLAVTFTDDQAITWMVHFETIKDKMNFMSELTQQGVTSQESALEQTKIESSISGVSSINEAVQFSSRLIAEKPEEEKTRADILGRMSKLGMSILPSSSSASSPQISKLSARMEKELSESEPEEVIRTTKLRKQRGRHSESAIDVMDLVQKPMVTQAQFTPFATNMQHVALGHQLMDPLNVYFAENRTHNSEVRMNLSQLGNKIDMLLAEMRPQTSPRNSIERDYLERRIIELERKLALCTGWPGSRQHADPGAEELEQKLAEEIKKNAQNVLKYDEIIGNLRKDNESLQDTRETERKLTQQQFTDDTEKISNLEDENQRLRARVAELEATTANQTLKLADFGDYYKKEQENKLDRQAREAAEQELKQRAEFLQASLDESNKKIEELQLLHHQVLESRTKEEGAFADLVKESMNLMYQSVLTDCIDSTTSPDIRDLKKILQKHLKSTTFAIINQYCKRKDLDSLGGQMIASVSPEFEVTV